MYSKKVIRIYYISTNGHGLIEGNNNYNLYASLFISMRNYENIAYKGRFSL